MAQKIELSGERWAERKKSSFVKWLISYSDVSKDAICEVLNISMPYFNNKITRNSFSFEDLITIAYMCGFKFSLESLSGESKVEIGLKDFLSEEEFDRVQSSLNKRAAEKHEEYLKKKKELELLKEKYGYED